MKEGRGRRLDNLRVGHGSINWVQLNALPLVDHLGHCAQAYKTHFGMLSSLVSFTYLPIRQKHTWLA